MSIDFGRALRFVCLASILAGAVLADGNSLPDKQSTEPAAAGSVLQPGDDFVIHSLQVKEIAEKTFRIDRNGEVNFPLAGILKLAGSTEREAEKTIAAALKVYYLSPDIELNVTSTHTEPVSILGSVGTPGIYPLKGKTALLEALSAAGGVRGDAGPVLVLTRQEQYGPIPHPNARRLATGESVAEIDVKSLTEARNSTDNISVLPHDQISVPAAQLIYVIGNVKRPGGFALGGRPNLSVIQALALAEGMDPRAAPERARILRRDSATRQDIAVDIRKILANKEEDIVLHPNDILFVPNSAMKTISTRTIEAAIQIGTGLAIFK